STLVRFVPVADFNGTPGGLTIRALDGTYTGDFSASGVSETRATLNTSTKGGATAISADTATIGTTVTAVNDAPELDDAQSPELTGIDEDPGEPVNAAGSTLVSAL